MKAAAKPVSSSQRPEPPAYQGLSSNRGMGWYCRPFFLSGPFFSLLLSDHPSFPITRAVRRKEGFHSLLRFHSQTFTDRKQSTSAGGREAAKPSRERGVGVKNQRVGNSQDGS